MTVSISRKHHTIHSYTDLFIIQHRNHSNVKQEKIIGNNSSDQSTSHHIKSIEEIVDEKQTKIQYHSVQYSFSNNVNLLHA